MPDGLFRKDEDLAGAPLNPNVMRPGSDSGDYSYAAPSSPQPAGYDTTFEGQGLPGMSPAPRAGLSGYDRARARLEREAEIDRSPVGRILGTLGRMGDAYQGKAIAPTAEEKLADLEMKQEAFMMQKAQAQANLAKSSVELVKQFQPIWSSLKPEQQDAIAANLAKIGQVSAMGSAEASFYTKDVVKQMLSNKGYGSKLVQKFTLLDEQEKADMAEWITTSNPTPAQIDAEADRRINDKVKPLQQDLMGKLGMLVAAAKTAAGKPASYQMPMTEFIGAVRDKFEDPLKREAFDRLIADPKNERFLVDAGLQSPKAVEAQQKAAAEAPYKEKEPFPKTALEWVAKTNEWVAYKKAHPTASVKTFDELPEDVQQTMLLAGDKLRLARDKEVREAEALATIRGQAAARQERTVAEVSPNMHAVDLDTGEEVTQSLLNEQLRTNPKKYKLMNAADYNNFRAAKENAEYLKTYRMAVKQLPMKPGENIGNYIDYRVKTALGDYHIGTTLKAMEALSLRFAGSLQGSRSQLSDQDRQAVMEMLPTAADTQVKATQKLDVLEKVFNTMEGVLTGRAKRSRLDELLVEHESLRSAAPVKRDRSVAPVRQ